MCLTLQVTKQRSKNDALTRHSPDWKKKLKLLGVIRYFSSFPANVSSAFCFEQGSKNRSHHFELAERRPLAESPKAGQGGRSHEVLLRSLSTFPRYGLQSESSTRHINFPLDKKMVPVGAAAVFSVTRLLQTCTSCLITCKRRVLYRQRSSHSNSSLH